MVAKQVGGGGAGGGMGPYGTMIEGAGVGLSFAFAVGIGTMVGLWVDNRWGLSPWGLLAGLVWGLAGGIKLLLAASKRLAP